MRIVDAHLHVWDTHRLDYPWLREVPDLDRPMTFSELAAERAGGAVHVDGFVFVQADCLSEQAVAEVDWVSSIAAEGPVVGIVAFAPLEQGDAVAAHLDALAERPLVIGVRRLLQSEPRGFSGSDSFIAGVRALAARSIVFDACVTEDQLDDVSALADAAPDLAIVLDHLGKPDIAAASSESWRASVSDLARRPNVACKVSGLPPQTGTADWSLDTVRPYLDTVLDAFGPDRLLFGSDWPASSGHTGYDRWLDAVLEWSAAMSGEERASLLAGTADRVYGIRPPAS
ncbi:amidohydrolase [Labedella phragmitis]|uniref:Amidohydrolase n=1 Tax=Labedella phragmitis TaxID=2498849 RepID=A0A444PY27_9MICO|nr:amidohydrolase family protein [Labedella phragmitis]RWZ52776.1 amidohydrolase [Labedella phragmitis]